MLWIGVHLPLLSLEAFAATLEGTLAGRPLALLEGTQVAAADAAAARLGVKPGLKRSTAVALAPALVFGEADAVRDAQALAAAAHAALEFTPAVTLHGTHTVLLEVGSTLRAFGGLGRLLARLEQALRPLAHTLRIASAPTALGAALLARWQRRGSDPARPPDLATLRALLDEAPVWLLGPGRAHWEALQGMGLATLADLRALPRAGLARRFGEALLADLDRARGDAPDPQDWVRPPAVFESRLELFARADTTDAVLHAAALLLARLVAWARAQHAQVARFTLAMHHERRHRADDTTPERTTLDIALAGASNDTAHLGTLLRERLARVQLPAPTLELSLQCRDLVHRDGPSGELFPTRASECEGLTRLVERLQARLGRTQVQRLQRIADHRPERATVCVPADIAPSPAQTAAPLPPLAQLADTPHLTRPLWLLPAPQPLAADARALPLLHGRPLLLRAGPERIEAGWWDGEFAARDYYVAQDDDGALLWVYRERVPPATGESGWHLHGRFG